MAATIIGSTEPEARLAVPEDDEGSRLTDMINEAYKIGEAGIFVDSPEEPFLRFMPNEVLDLISKERMIVLELNSLDKSSGNSLSTKHIVGCIKIDPSVESIGNKSGKVGEWGGLAVAKEYQGRGFGSILQRAAEEKLKTHGCTVAQLELLTPSTWKHEHKERLRGWYVDKLGFQLQFPGDYDRSTTKLPSGSLLMDRMLLVTDADFTIYRRALD